MPLLPVYANQSWSPAKGEKLTHGPSPATMTGSEDFTPQVIAMRKNLTVASTIVVALAGLFELLAIATPGWLKNPEVNIGLFMFCGQFRPDVRTDSTSVCGAIPAQYIIGSLHAMRALCIINLLVTGLALAFSVTHLWCVVRHDTVNRRVAWGCVILLLSAALLTVVTILVFAASTRLQMPRDASKPHQYTLHYSFALHVIGGICLLLGAGLEIISVKCLTKMLLV